MDLSQEWSSDIDSLLVTNVPRRGQVSGVRETGGGTTRALRAVFAVLLSAGQLSKTQRSPQSSKRSGRGLEKRFETREDRDPREDLGETNGEARAPPAGEAGIDLRATPREARGLGAARGSPPGEPEASAWLAPRTTEGLGALFPVTRCPLVDDCLPGLVSQNVLRSAPMEKGLLPALQRALTRPGERWRCGGGGGGLCAAGSSGPHSLTHRSTGPSRLRALPPPQPFRGLLAESLNVDEEQVLLLQVVYYVFHLFNVSIFLRERERQDVSGLGAEREGDTGSEAGSSPDAGLEPTSCELMT